MSKRPDQSSPQEEPCQDTEDTILSLSYAGLAVALTLVVCWFLILGMLLHFAQIDSDCLGGFSSRNGESLELVLCAPKAGLKGWAVLGWMVTPLGLLRVLIVRARRKASGRNLKDEAPKG